MSREGGDAVRESGLVDLFLTIMALRITSMDERSMEKATDLWLLAPFLLLLGYIGWRFVKQRFKHVQKQVRATES